MFSLPRFYYSNIYNNGLKTTISISKPQIVYTDPGIGLTAKLFGVVTFSHSRHSSANGVPIMTSLPVSETDKHRGIKTDQSCLYTP